MDVSELLAYKPDRLTSDTSAPIAPSSGNLKRKRRLEGDSYKQQQVPSKKQAKQAALPSADDLLLSKTSSQEEQDIERVQQILGDDRTDVEPAMDETTIKKLLVQFEKKFHKNQEMRIKHPNNPEKFMDSEVELNEVIQELQVIATMPNLYPVVIESGTVKSFLQLIGHENADVAIATVDLLQEMTDTDALEETDGEEEELIDALLEGQVLALLVQNLERLDESSKEEATGIHNSLAIVENMIDLRSEVSTDAGKQGVIQWLIKKLKVKASFDDNRLYYSELLSILVQNHKENCEIVGESEGIDVLLSQLFVFKKRDPNSPEEIEFMENLFNTLCSCLLLPSNRGRFLKGEGLHLMNLMLKEKKKVCRTSALKVLNYAMGGEEGYENCNKYVDILGLPIIFPFFMKTPSQHKKAGPNKQDIEEHVISVVASLVRNCEGQQRQRLLAKFTENDHEKVERLMELHFNYLNKSRQVEDAIDRQKMEIERDGGEIGEDEEDEFYLKRLDAGLFTLQLIDYIIVEICSSSPPSMRERVTCILNMRRGTMSDIKSVIREYAGKIGDSDKASQKTFQDRLIMLVDKF